MSIEKQSWRLFVSGAGVAGDVLTLGEDEHHYAFHVLRLQAGEHIEVGDGRGFVADAVLTRVDKKGAEVSLLVVRPERRAACRVTLFLAQPKPSTLEEVVALVSELGVARVVVFRSRRCQGKAPAKLEKLQRLSFETLRVTKGFRATEVVIVDTAAALEIEHAAAGRLFLCDETPQSEGNDLASAIARAPEGDVGIIVGPEASFTIDERSEFQRKGALPVSLGPLILRVPTAVAYAASVVLAARCARWA